MTRNNLLPAKRIILAGNIRLNRVEATNWENWTERQGTDRLSPIDRNWREKHRRFDTEICENTCRALLEAPGVTSVTVDPDPGAPMKIALDPHAQIDPCSNTTIAVHPRWVPNGSGKQACRAHSMPKLAGLFGLAEEIKNPANPLGMAGF